MLIGRSLLLLGVFVSSASAADVTAARVQASIPELDRFAEQVLQKTGVPGMGVAVVYKDRIVHVKGYGVRDAGTQDRVGPGTVFQIASLSKPLATTVLAAIVGEGIIGWDDRLIDHDPGFRMYDPWVTREVTFRDMLCHRSGLPDHAGDHLEDIGYDRAEVLLRLRYEKPASSFRSTHAYTNFGFTEAGVAGAMAAKSTWEDLAAKKLFQPLGMASSSFRHADYASAKDRAKLHVRIDGKWAAKWSREPDAQSPAGGASSTPRDMAQWLRVQLNAGTFDGKQVIAAKALGETHVPQIITHAPANPAVERAGFYGLGWNVGYDDAGRVRLSHSGAFSLGAATCVMMLPGEGLGIVVLTNGMPIGVPEAVCATYLDLVLNGKIEKDWVAAMKPLFDSLMAPDYGTTVDYTKPVAKPAPALTNGAYVGSFTNDYFGELEVVEKDGALMLLLGPKKTPYALKHYDRDVFTYQPPGENAYGRSGVTFLVGADGKALRVLVENLDKNGQGTFTRRIAKK